MEDKTVHQLLIYGLILIFKTIEVSMATLRIVLITKDERLKGAIIGFFEVMLWVILVSTVLTNITEDPIKVVIYALGFAVGNYVGSKVENFIAIGTSNIEAIVLKQHGKQLSIDLRARGYAVTAVDAKGMNSDREILYIHLPRKQVRNAVSIIRDLQENVVITINDIKPIYGGYRTLRR
jgi:uncharacterized protein YebE (UPF0316 family)